MPDTEHKNSNNIKDKVSTANVEPFVEVLTNIEISVGKSLFIVKGMSSDKILCDLSNENSEIKSLGSSPATALINCPSLNYDDLSIRLNITEIANDSIVFSPNDSDASTKIDALLSSLRKEQHIEICAKKDVEHSSKSTGFSNFNFIPLTFPELNYEDIDISSSFLGKKFSAPIFITGMTGGVKRGGEINKRIALACEKYSIPMGVGSQRIALEHPEYSDIFDVKKYAPNLFVIGNIGVAQLLKGIGIDECKKAVDMIKADALALHVNVLQEMIQVEGDRNFKGIFEKIEAICSSLKTPIIIKEVGSGIDLISAKRLVECGVSAIDIGGAGGTSWGFIEGLRAKDQKTKNLASQFRNWGIPTAYSLKALSNQNLGVDITATGGIRDGLTAAKAVSLGASLAGIGLPIFKAALSENENAVNEKIEEIIEGIKITSMLTGSKNLDNLKQHITTGLPYSELTEM